MFGTGITHVSPWELMPLLPPQPQQTMQQQQHIRQLQQQLQLSGAGLQTAVLPGGSSAMPLLHVQSHAPQYPMLQAGCVVALSAAVSQFVQGTVTVWTCLHFTLSFCVSHISCTMSHFYISIFALLVVRSVMGS